MTKEIPRIILFCEQLDFKWNLRRNIYGKLFNKGFRKFYGYKGPHHPDLGEEV